jgi:hypothetical protein
MPRTVEQRLMPRAGNIGIYGIDMYRIFDDSCNDFFQNIIYFCGIEVNYSRAIEVNHSKLRYISTSEDNKPLKSRSIKKGKKFTMPNIKKNYHVNIRREYPKTTKKYKHSVYHRSN